MAGLTYNVPRSLAEAGAFAKGSLNLISAQNLTQISLGLDACCSREGSNATVEKKLGTIVDDGKIIISTGEPLVTGCYDISVHRCDDQHRTSAQCRNTTTTTVLI